ncbi:MAG: rod shape-determining protein, partial [Selenomonadaceae bacterium]|nr:rod shape-determining protein [Selenomonadaceae bacterium]
MPKKISTVEEPETKVKRRRRTVKADDAPKPAARRSARAKNVETPKPDYSDREKIFALDIGTRSVIGIVAVKEPDDSLTIIATQRREHKTRAMLDGQIHDVPKVAAIIKEVTDELEKEVGALKSAAVAAAGRELFTVTADASFESDSTITDDEETNLKFAAVQNAQANLASLHSLNPEDYYCVGYSTIKYELDGVRLKSLVGQRGRLATATVIATFLPCQVINSIQSALDSVGLEVRALTLEPIAAINVLILPSMQHLNLVLVDIGAGTSDIAITTNGSIIAYGMVPVAGDEITDAISQNFLLDFNVAENVKRNAAIGQRSTFGNILGDQFDLTPEEV